jgi:hypothetical protein
MQENKIDDNDQLLLFKKVSPLTKDKSNSLKSSFRGSFKKKDNKHSLKKVQIILPNLSQNKKPNTINDDKEKINNEPETNTMNTKSIKNSLFNDVKDTKTNTNNSNISNNPIISLKKDNNDIIEYTKKNNNSPNFNTIDFEKNQKNKQIIKKHLLSNKSISYRNSKPFKNKEIESNINNNLILELNNKNNDFKNVTKSSFEITKLKLNDSTKDRNILKNLSTSLRSRKFKKSYIRNNSSIIVLPKHSRFFNISQNDNISAKKIYRHYLNKSAGEIVQPIKNYTKFFNNKTSFFEKLSRIYCENQNFLSTIKEIKDNKKIAFKSDFHIEEYQSTIIELMNQRVSQKYLIDLQNDYRTLNKKIFGVVEPKGRYTLLAEKLRYNLPAYLLEKLKQMDKDTIITRMNYYNKFKKFRGEKKLISRFTTKNTTNNKKDSSFDEDPKKIIN